jgi:hypothetical protein
MADEAVPEALDDAPPTDAELLAWLRAAVDPDGTLRVRRLAVVDGAGRECVVLQRDRLRAEVAVSLPESAGGGPASISLYAQNGEPDDPAAEPAVGAVIVVGGNEAATVDVVPDRWGGWELHASTEGPTAVGVQPR